jgi:multidrug efflux pump subunit AcrA (membrane-fusion protein)
MLKSYRFAFIVLSAALMVAIELSPFSAGCGGSSVKVTAQRVGKRAIAETVMIAGNLQASAPAQVIPQVSGSVARVYAQAGREVTAGEPIIQLDTSNLEQSVLSAEASLESTQGIAGAFNGLSTTANDIGSAVNSTLSGVDAGVTSLYNLQKLLVPALPEDQRLAALQAIESFYQQYMAGASDRPSFGGASAGLSTGAQQAAAENAAEIARQNLQAATVVSPASGTLVAVQSSGSSISGMVSALMSSFSDMLPSGLNLSSLSGLTGGISSMGMPSSGEPVAGSFITAGTAIYQVVDLKSMSLVAKVDESDIAKIQPGQAATVGLEAYPEKEYPGIVAKIADVATTNEAGATAFDVTVQMDQADVRLKIGMTGTADVTIATKKATTVVPVEAIVDKKGKKYVYTVVDGKARLVPVELGLTTENSVEIIEGVEVGDKVVIKGVEKVKDGQAVKI